MNKQAMKVIKQTVENNTLETSWATLFVAKITDRGKVEITLPKRAQSPKDVRAG
jgi:hypothetical protein